MLGSYGPSPDGKPYERPNFHTEESPSGLIARQGTYNVRSKFIDDDGEIHAGALLLPTVDVSGLTRDFLFVMPGDNGML